ncbi:MAG: DNA internalization-related competence protein ComEC/Rec2 [Candidatus Brocadiales bacterium]
MKHRPLLFVALAFAAGIFLDYSAPLPLLVLSVLAIGLLVSCWCVMFVWRSGLVYMAICLTLAFWTGAFYHHVSLHSCPADHIANLLTAGDTGDKRLMRVRGVIVDVPIERRMPQSPLPWKQVRTGRTGIRFTLRVEGVEGRTGWHRVGGTVLANVYKVGRRRFRYGEEVEVLGQVFIPGGATNPGQFDYRRYLRRQMPGICAVVNVEDADNVRVIRDDRGDMFLRGIYDLKERLSGVIRSSALPGSASTLAGLILGNRQEIPGRTIEDFIRTGTLHFLAISGLHVGILVVSIYTFLLLLRVPKRVVVLIIIVFVSIYAILTGLRPPVLRASLMVIFIFGAYLVRRQWDFASGISAAVLAMLVWNPFDLFNVGFQLSVSGVLGIVYLAPRIETFFWGDSLLVERLQSEEERPRLFLRLWPYLRVGICISLGAWIATSPLILYYFHRVVPFGAPLSVIVFPLVWVITVCGFVMLPLGLVSPVLATPVAYLAQGADVALKAIISFAASVPLCSFYSPAPSWPWLVVLYALALLLVFRGAVGLRLAHTVGICLIVGNVYLYGHIVGGVLSRDSGVLSVTGLDVRHGSCAFIRFPDGSNMLYDAGKRGWSDVGKRVIVPFLWHMGVRRVDAVVISHGDTDHYNGLPSLVDRFRIGKVLVNERMFRSSDAESLFQFLADKGVRVEVIGKGTELGGQGAHGGARVSVLNPPGGAGLLSRNDASCVLKIEYEGRSVLLCGDVGSRGVNLLLDSGYGLTADVVQAPHHGNRIGNVGDLYAVVKPRFILVSTGSPKDLSGVKPEGSLVLQTYETGAASFDVDKSGVKVRTFNGVETPGD